MDTTQTLYSISGPDRPGLLDDLAGAIARNEGNIVDLRTIELRGQFSMLVLVVAHQGATQAITCSLQELAAYSGLTVNLAAAAERDTPEMSQYLLSAIGPDQPGVVKQVSHLMKALSINIDHVETHTNALGEMKLSFVLEVARNIPLTKLREFVGQLFSELGLTWNVEPYGGPGCATLKDQYSTSS